MALGKSFSEIDDMDADEVLMWQTYLALEPHGEKRLDYNAAQITQSIYTFMSILSKNSKNISIEKCLLKFQDPESTKDQQNRNVHTMLMAFGAKKIPKLKHQLETQLLAKKKDD
jgi:hypothetical protein